MEGRASSIDTSLSSDRMCVTESASRSIMSMWCCVKQASRSLQWRFTQPLTGMISPSTSFRTVSVKGDPGHRAASLFTFFIKREVPGCSYDSEARTCALPRAVWAHDCDARVHVQPKV